MGKLEFPAMKTDDPGSNALRLIDSDLLELRTAVANLASDAVELAGSLRFVSFFLMFLASAAAIYLLILDRTKWRANILTSLLVPYIFVALPSVIFSLLRGEIGKWIAFIAVVLRLFLRRHFPGWLELPGSLILVLVVAPEFFTHEVRDNWVGVVVCMAIGCYLLQEHFRASGGFRSSLTSSNGLPNTLGIIILLAFPIWCLVLRLHWTFQPR